MSATAFRSLGWLDHGRRPALHLEPGGGDDRTLPFDELIDAVRHRAARLAGTTAEDPDVRVHTATHPHAAEQAIEVLAALVAGRSVLPLNAGWWPRERDAALDRLADAAASTASAAAPVLWMASAGSDAEPTPYAFTVEQVAACWCHPTAGLEPGDRVVVTGDVGHAPVLRTVLGALAAGASVQITGRAHLAALLGAGPIELLCTTPPLLRRALRQLQRRDRPAAGVRATVLHQGAVRAHEHERWPSILDGMVWERVSLTEAGGWLPAGWRVGAAPSGTPPRHGAPGGDDGDGVEVLRDGDGGLSVRGDASAFASAGAVRPPRGWPTGDVALEHEAASGGPGALRRQRDRFLVDGVWVDPVAVEAAVAAHPLVADVVVAPRPDPGRGNIAVAVLIPADPDWPPFLEDLAETTGGLADAARPAALAVVDDVPLNAAGAVSRRLVNYEEAGR